MFTFLKPSMLAIIVCAVLAGCATNQQNPAQLASTHGFVQALAPSAWITPVDSITLRSKATGERFALNASGAGIKRYSLWVPAGEYEIDEMVGEKQTSLPVIQVKPGRATDLGGLKWFGVGGYERMLIPFSDSDSELAGEAKAGIEQISQHLVTSEFILWRPNTLPPTRVIGTPPTNLGLVADLLAIYGQSVNRPSIKKQLKEARSVEEFLRLSRQASVPTMDEPAGDAGGPTYFPADFGQIRVRSPSGEWSAIDTGTVATLTAVHIDGGDLVAGTLHGQIRTRDSVDGDGRWRILKALPDDEAIVDIDRSGARWLILTAKVKPTEIPNLVTIDQLRVHAASHADMTDLVPIKTFDINARTFMQFAGARGQIFGNYYYLNAVKTLERLDLRTMQWESISPSHAVSQFRVSEPSGTLTAFMAQGVFSKLSVSNDGGKNWKRVETPPYTVNDVFFSNPNEAQATRWSTGMFTANIEFLRFDSAEQAWPKVAEASPESCRRTLRTQDGNTLICVSRSGSLLRFTGNDLLVEFAAD